MIEGLEYLLSEGIISEVVARLQSGKEAEVFVVRYGGKDVAAKAYKDRAHRSFKNNSAYKEGRNVRSSRDQRAMERGSKFGKAAAEEAWKAAEVDALYKLHAAGVRVPTPVMFLEGVLLMELVLGADGRAAPRIIDAPLTVAEANAAYHDMLGQLVRMLCCDLIHGDLSPYNVLWAAGGPTVIDFPQIIAAAANSRAESFFIRDARNILGYFASIDPSLNARSGDPHEIWRAYMRRELTPDFLPTGRGRAVAPPMAPRPMTSEQPSRDGTMREGPRGGTSEGRQDGSRNAREGAPRDRSMRDGAPRPQQRPNDGQPSRGAPPQQANAGPPRRGGPPQRPQQGPQQQQPSRPQQRPQQSGQQQQPLHGSQTQQPRARDGAPQQQPRPQQRPQHGQQQRPREPEVIVRINRSPERPPSPAPTPETRPEPTPDNHRRSRGGYR